MAWEKTVTQNALKEAGRIVLEQSGHKIMLLWHEDKPYAVASQCPHLRLPLKKAKVTEDCKLVCPFHKSTFDLDTGEVVCWSTSPPLIGPLLGKASSEKPLPVYPVRLDGEHLFVDLGSD